jgi:hypothetical protein
MNPAKGTFSAKGANLILSEFKNPLAVRLTAGAFDECSMPLFKETARLWRFSGKKNSQYACQITDVPQTDPSGFLINTPQNVRIQARLVPSQQLDQNSVRLFEVDPATQLPAGNSLCNLLDNGSLGNGDDVGGDHVFSCIVSFNEQTPRRIRLIVQAALNSAVILSPGFSIDAVAPITSESASELVNDQQAADQIWQDKLAEFGDGKKARTEAIKAIKQLDGVASAGISKDGVTVWIKYESGIIGGLMLNPAGTRGSSGRESAGPRADRPAGFSSSILPALFSRHTKKIYGGPSGNPFAKPASSLTLAAGEDHPVGNNKVLIWDAYNFQFAPFDEGPGLQQLFQGSQCPKFDVTYLKDNQATIDSVRSFSQYGTVILVTHGAVDGDGQVVFLTTENANAVNILLHAIDLVLGRVTVMGNVFAIRPSFITHLPGVFESAIIYNGSCQSSANNTMANAFSGKGTNTYYGFTRVVNSDFAQNAATQLFANLVSNLHNTGNSFNPVAPKIDPKTPFATFTQGGDDKTAYTGQFRNGDFEAGDLSAWTRSGDGRVVSGLGEFGPSGNFMGLISTGLGFTESAGSIEQNFCLPANATHLAFNWNFSSEEFKEFCNSQFDDNFDVELVTDSGSSALFHASVNGLCATGPLAQSGLVFDKGDVWTTGWVSESIDIAGIAAANNGKGVKIIFKSSDQGDSIYDTAILLDDIRVVTP